MKYLLVTFALLGGAVGCGGNDNCAAATACSADATKSTRLCTGNGGDCYYLTSDGQRFHCVTCGDCAAAQASAAQYCGDSSGNLSMCSAAVQCPSSGRKGSSYQACSSPTGSDCGFKTSDGKIYTCASCGDCAAAVTQATTWCSAPPGSCDLILQDCGAGMKCAPDIDNQGNVISRCGPDGTADLNQACVATSTTYFYTDNCKAGLICGYLGQCSRVCSADSDCGNQRCVALYLSGTNGIGECETTCTPFAAGGCPLGSDCSASASDVADTGTATTGYFFCKPAGNVTRSGACAAEQDCGQGLTCSSNSTNTSTCQPNCSASRPCPSGDSCTTYSNLNGAGYCVAQ